MYAVGVSESHRILASVIKFESHAYKASNSENDSECVLLWRRQIIADTHKNSFQDVLRYRTTELDSILHNRNDEQNKTKKYKPS
jgi:hypothetical protein